MLEWDTIGQTVVQLIGIQGAVAPVGTPANDLILGVSNANSTIAVIKPAGTPSSECLLPKTANMSGSHEAVSQMPCSSGISRGRGHGRE